MFKKSVVLAKNLKSTAEIRRGFVGIYLHPLYVTLFMWPIVLRLVGTIGQEIRNLPPYVDNLYYVFRIALFYVALFTYCPAVLKWATERNIPIAVTTFVFFAVHSFASAMYGHFVLEYPTTMAGTLWMFVRHMALALMIHILAMLYYEKQFRAAVGRDPDFVPFSKPLPRAQLSYVSASLIDPALSGRLLYLQAQNQYVTMGTETGMPMVRISFSKAVANLPAEAGLVVHRSWWVASSAAKNIRLDARAEELVMQDGLRIPVSKAKLDDVQAWLAKLQAA